MREEADSFLNQLSLIEGELRQLNSQQGRQREISKSLERLQQGYSAAFDEGLVSKIEVEARHRDTIASRQRENQLSQEILRAENQKRQILSSWRKTKIEVDRRKIEYESRASAIRQQMLQIRQGEEYDLVSSIEGTIAALQIVEGRWVDGKIPLGTVAAKDSSLVAELYIPVTAAGFLASGQPVKLMIDSFPYQSYGVIEAEIVDISKAVQRPDEIDTSLKLELPTYRALADLKTQQLINGTASYPIQAGMTLKASIQVGKRSFWEWLFNPILAFSKRYV